MGNKDIVSKTILQKLAVDIATLLLKLEVEPEDAEVLEVDPEAVEMLDTERQRFEVRRADVVVRMRDKQTGEPFIFHLEVQNNNDPAMPVRMMRYFTDIRLSYPNEPVRQYLVYIGKAQLGMPDYLTNPGFTYRYGMLDMHTVDCQSLIAMDKPEALVLAILCDFGNQSPDNMVNSIVIRLKQLLDTDEAKFRNYFQMLETLAVNRDLLDKLNEAKAMLSEIDVKKFPTFKWGLEKGRKEGKEEGREEGKEEVAHNLLRGGQLDEETIAAVTGLTLERIKELHQQLTH